MAIDFKFVLCITNFIVYEMKSLAEQKEKGEKLECELYLDMNLWRKN